MDVGINVLKLDGFTLVQLHTKRRQLMGRMRRSKDKNERSILASKISQILEVHFLLPRSTSTLLRTLPLTTLSARTNARSPDTYTPVFIKPRLEKTNGG